MNRFFTLRCFLNLLFISVLLVFLPSAGSQAYGQIYEPEGINMPGGWNDWENPPSNLALASYAQVAGGRITKISSGATRWQTVIKVASSGGDIIAGTYEWLFSSGAIASPWSNKWNNVTVVANTLQNYTYGGADNNQITVANGKWYTMNWADNGYAGTQAIFMETSGDPVSLASLSVPGLVSENQQVDITLTVSANPAAEELFYMAYSGNNWATTLFVPFVMSGTTGTATIPGQPAGTTVRYYGFSSTVSGLTANDGLYSIMVNNNGGINFSYEVAGLSNEADILAFSLPQQTASATINSLSETVDVEVVYGTDLTALVPEIAISEGAQITPQSGTAQNFSAPFVYTVTAEDGIATKEWTVNVTEAEPPAPEYGLRDDGGVNLPDLTYWHSGLSVDVTQKGSAFNGQDFGSITAFYVKGSTIKSWKSGSGDVTGAQFRYKVWSPMEPEPAGYSVRNVAWTSNDGVDGDQTWANFGVPVLMTDGLADGTYNLKIEFAIDGVGVAGTIVEGPFEATFNYEQFSSQAEIITFSLPQQTAEAIINTEAATVDITVGYGTALTSLAPSITVSAGAQISPASGAVLDFSSPVLYTVTAENSTTEKQWTINIIAAQPVISWANLEWPSSGLIQPNHPFDVYAQVYSPGVTPAGGQGSGIGAWIGYSDTNSDPATWTHWVVADYQGDDANNDEYRADLGSLLAIDGTYYYASRFLMGTGAYVYGGFSTSGGGIWDGTSNQSGVLLVTTPAIAWANLQSPGSATIALGESFNVYGQVLVNGFSGQSVPVGGLEAWVGISTTDTDPATWTNWLAASYRGAIGNNDEFVCNLASMIPAAGNYYYATRYQLNEGGFVYGGYSASNGGIWDGSTNVSGVLAVITPSINWASLHWPGSQTIEPGQPFNVFGRVWIDGHTGGSVPLPSLQAWVGYSSENTNPNGWTNWFEADYNVSVENNDEFVANLGAQIITEGTYYYATRFKVYNQDYVYGGYSISGGGFWDGTTNMNGVLTVGFDIDCTTYAGTAWSEPSMPLDNEPVTVYFDAAKGNNALLNYAGDVYAHTAVLTNLSNGSGDWRYTKTYWGENTPSTKLTRLTDNLYSLTIDTPRSYYNVPIGEMIQKMVFVFRSDVVQSSGSYLEHRNSDGSDIAVQVYESGLHVTINNPSGSQTILDQSTTLPVCVSATGNNQIALFINNNQLALQSGGSLSYMLIMAQLHSGQNWLKATAQNGTELVADSISIYLRGPVTIADLPSGVQNGINYINDTTATLVLHDPTGFKQYVYAIGAFNNWQISNENYMKRTPDGKRYWLTITGLEPGEEYPFQYFIDGEIKIADAYAHKVLDPWNDQWISSSTYPNPSPYPSGYTDGVVSILQTAQPEYDWQMPNFTPPAINNAQSDLVIYELLIRDFVESKSISDVALKLDYLKNLGVNAIELMPVAEFDGNDSWGYSTNFFFAADKAYGTVDAYKAFIDAAHQRGIAVIVDIVPNHAFGLCPMVQMYFDGANNRPSEHNPWFNQQSPHGYSVGYDFNHESGHTRQFFKDVFQYWLSEFKVDGFRIDLSKGLTQTYTGGDIGAWNAYDQSRVDILNDYKAHIKWVNPNAYVILEHFADNSEETVLANSGMMLWSAMHSSYKQVAMGWENSSDVSWAFHGTRGWNYPNLVDYMETHDEERMMAEALSNGNSTNPTYDIKYFGNALHHQEQAMVLFMGIPGPKMLYQFQEMGYDYSILYGGGRTDSKPPRWDYLDVPGRERLTRVVSAMSALRKTDAFRYGSFYHELGLQGKKMWITHSSMDVIVTVNMGVNGFDMAPGFTKSGTWYDYFTGESFYVSDPGGHFFFYGPGDYKVFTSEPMPKPFYDLVATVVDGETGLPIEGVTVSLSNSGNRTTGSDGKAAFLALPQEVSVMAQKFGWFPESIDTTIGQNTTLTLVLQPGWDQAKGWVNLEWPENGQIEPADAFNVYAQVWIDGVTNELLPDNGLEVWIGYSETNTDPATWTDWVPAVYDAAVADNDQYVANLGEMLSTTGTFYYASRFSRNSGVNVYGGHSSAGGGFWDGANNVSGVVQVSIPPVGWANLQHPGSGQIDPGDGFDVFARVYIENKTGQSLANPFLEASIGYSTSNTDPTTWVDWIPATYVGSVDNNDEYRVNLGASITESGTYYYASRFKYKTGDEVFGGFSASGGGFWNGAGNVSGVLLVNPPPPTVIDWANLQWPAFGSIEAGTDYDVYGQAYVSGLTGQATPASGLQAWIGYSTQDSDPESWTNWMPAVYNAAEGNNDEFVYNLGSHILSAGSYYYAYRYQLNNGLFYYGGYSEGGGGFWDGTSFVSGQLTVTVSDKTLNLTSIFPEGLYLANGFLRQAMSSEGAQFEAGIADLITIELRESVNYSNLLFSVSDVPLSISGAASVLIPSGFNQLYYITIKHRNSIEVTTSTPVSFASSVVSRSFGSGLLVFGQNLALSPDGNGLIYTGDVNQDGVVDDADMQIVATQSALFTRGYILSDLNGDGVTDAIDFILLDNNAARVVGKITP